MFDVAVYTDARPEESLSGKAGFQFIAKSSGVTAMDLDFIEKRGKLLHLVKQSWALDHGAEEGHLTHPHSCKYVRSDDRFYLSRGRSTGMTITSPRPGNQLTETIVTSSSDDLVPYRPAQLYAANGWNLSAPGTKQIQPWATPLEIDPSFEAHRLKEDLVTNSPFGVDFLPIFLTMVEQATSEPAKKLIIVHTELETVMRYIALASLFVDYERALDLTFAALVDGPSSYVAHIVGATPAFGAVPHVSDPAFNVLDLLLGDLSPIEVSNSAAQQAVWFIEGDPLESLAAIDLARRWEPLVGAEIATSAAGIVSFDAPDLAGNAGAPLRVVSGLAGAGMAEDLDLYADEILDALTNLKISTDEEVSLAAGAIGDMRRLGGLDDLATALSLGTLQALARRMGLISAWIASAREWQTATAPMKWNSSADHERALRAQTEVINAAAPEDLVEVLVAARTLAMLPDERSVGPALDRLADYWCRHSEVGRRKDDLPYQGAMGIRLVAGLVRALELGDDQVTEDFVMGAWNWLGGSETSLAGWHAAARIGNVSLDRRADEIASAGHQLPPASWPIVLGGADIADNPEVVEQWVRVHRELSADLSDWIEGGLSEESSTLDGATRARRVLFGLSEVRAVSPNRKLSARLSHTAELRSIFEVARRQKGQANSPALHDFANRLGPAVPFFATEIGLLLVGSRDERAKRMLERAAGDFATECIDAELNWLAEHEGDSEAVTSALVLCESGSEVQRAAGAEYLISISDSRRGRDRLDGVRSELGRSLVPLLDEVLDDAKRGRMTRNLVRGGKRLFGKEK